MQILLIFEVLRGLELPGDVQGVRGIADFMLMGLAVAREEDLLGDATTVPSFSALAPTLPDCYSLILVDYCY